MKKQDILLTILFVLLIVVLIYYISTLKGKGILCLNNPFHYSAERFPTLMCSCSTTDDSLAPFTIQNGNYTIQERNVRGEPTREINFSAVVSVTKPI